MDSLPQPPMQKAGIEIGLSQKDVLKSFLSNGKNPCEIHRRPTKFLKFHTSRNISNLDWKEPREEETKEGHHTPKILQARNRLLKLLGWKHMLPPMKKGGLLWQQSHGTQRIVARPWNLMFICLTWFQNCVGYGNYRFFFPLFFF